MQRRFNYTGRKRIRRGDVRIFADIDQGRIAFNAQLESLRRYGLPPDALVFVEAYRQTNWMRFSFGRVEAISPPSDRKLGIFDSIEGVRFRVKVTASGDAHNLLAEADGIPLLDSDSADAGRKSLLQVKPERGMKEIFRLDFSDGPPILLINSDLGNYADIVRSPLFTSIAFPAILREVVTRIVLVDDQEEFDDVESWQSQWLKFCSLLPNINSLPVGEQIEEKADWIDSVVSAFAQKINVIGKFTASWEGAA